MDSIDVNIDFDLDNCQNMDQEIGEIDDCSISKMDEIFDNEQYTDKHKNYERLMNTLSYMQSTTEFEQSFYDDHIMHIHAYRLVFPAMRDMHTEVEAKNFRTMLDECDKLMDLLIDMYDCHRWFPIGEYYKLNELLIDVTKYVWSMDELEDLFINMKTS